MKILRENRKNNSNVHGYTCKHTLGKAVKKIINNFPISPTKTHHCMKNLNQTFHNEMSSTFNIHHNKLTDTTIDKILYMS